jgi:hypothetical protein
MGHYTARSYAWRSPATAVNRDELPRFRVRCALPELHGYNQPLVLEVVPTPDIGPDQVLVKVGAAGMCRTDVQLAASPSW